MMYTPKPIDTSGIELPEDLLALTEQIAENVHEVWASGRLAEGWHYGEVRDDRSMETPCLVPYDELTETERDYDRHTALETLKTIIALGYTIQKRSEPAADAADDT
ncbi:MAG: Ryanodine receptor Ryr [Oscillospiraceae bacterium]|nr:Ryanodine receptor Ryr [Oscillospiraceae bacterium]